MKQRKKIKYVEKQPPDKSASVVYPPKVEQGTAQVPSFQSGKPLAPAKEDQTARLEQTYLIQRHQHNPSRDQHPTAHYQHQHRPRYMPKEDHNSGAGQHGWEQGREGEGRKYDHRRGQANRGVPKMMERESSRAEIHCIICSQEIRRKDYIWTCACCCISMHLRCIKEWIKNVNKQLDKQASHIFNWKCPQCNYEYNEPLPKYYCFCGKHLNPEFDRDLQPHSCGELCDKKRGQYCPHPCPLVCHSGKCPPCELEGTIVTCLCGKSQRSVRCSEQRVGFQCGRKCQKVLDCQKHKCERNCHPGPCQPCRKKKMSECYCGKSSDVVDCREVGYSCGEICDRKLDCGYHKCEMKCHLGPCNSCRRTPQLQSTCPCGKYSIEMLTGDPQFRKSCAEPIPVCGMPCSRRLDCGHVCPRSCHEGPCPPCRVTVDQGCQCGSTARKIECHLKAHQAFRCETICKRKRSCGNHICNEVCCPHRTSPLADNHPCDLNCTKMLNCGRHECGEPCHLGNCKKCPVIYSQPQPCPCGRTFQRPPIICGTVVPECDNQCGKEMPCGHFCRNLCHYGNCRCVEEAEVGCRCGREKIKTTCGRQALCLVKCPKILVCGHKCDLQCHRGTCEEAHVKEPCRKICGGEREDCKHLCKQLCHPDRKCQQFVCEAEVLVKCECGHRQTMTLCGAKEQNITKKSIVCNKKCQNMKRFDVFYRDKEIYYPGNMVQFGFRNYPFLQGLEGRLEKFILRSEENFLEIQYKFPEGHTKLLLTDLFENHYHLNTHFYRHGKFAAFTLMQSEHTMIPKPVLSEYVRLVAEGKVKQSNLPFEFTVSFEIDQREKIELIVKSIREFLHKFYTERNGKHVALHFWNKDDGEEALRQLEDQFQTVDFKCSYNIPKQEEEVKQNEIVQVQEFVEKKDQQQTKTDNRAINEEKPEIKATSAWTKGEQQTKKVLLVGQKQAQNTGNESQYEKKGKLIVRRGIPTFRKNDYPESKDNVQDFYKLDEQQLFGQKMDWPKYIAEICDNKMGPQATEWRIRTLLILSTLTKVQESSFKQLYQTLTSMYNKDKQAAMRILEIQRIQSRAVKREMAENGIYLSDHEPQMLAYLQLFNYLAIQKLPLDYPDVVLATPEIKKTHEIIEAFECRDLQSFYDHFRASDFLLACALVPLVHFLRETVVEDIIQGARYPTKELHKWLLFDTKEQLLAFFEKNGLVMESRMSKSTREQIYCVKEGQLAKQRFEDDSFVKTKVTEKRDKKFFLLQPEELYQEKYLTLSFFAFGDFKESISQVYMTALVRLLKERDV